MGVYVNENGQLTPIAGGTFYADTPIGSILAYGGTDMPTGWLLCDGTALNRIEYKDLFDIIGTSFGEGDGSTTFNIPDLRGEFLRGAGNNSHSNQGNGGSVGEHQDGTEIPRVKETSSGLYGFYVSGEEADYKNIDSVISIATNLNNHSATASGASSDISATFTSRPTNTSVNYLIKCNPVALPLDFAKYAFVEVTGTLEAGETSLTLSDATITADSTLNIYTSVYGVSPTNVVASGGSVTLTFDAQANNVDVKGRLS